MSISTQTAALLDFYNQKISLDKKQLDQITSVQTGYTITTGVGSSDYIKVWGPSDVIENYREPIEKIDNRILEINNQIANLRSQILTIGQNASAAGCGTTGSSVTVVSPTISCKVYSFSGTNPFSETTQTLSSSNLGVGVTNSIANVSIGTYPANIGTCSTITGCTGAPGGSCVAAAASITYFENQIPALETQRNDLITKVNFLKNERVQYELQNYAYNQSKAQINSSIGISSSVIDFLKDPNNAEWL